MKNEYLEEDAPIGAAFPAHPGAVLKLVLPARKMKAGALAEAIGSTRPAMSKRLAGRMALTPAMALRIERAIGYSAELLVTMQANYSLAKVRREEADAIR